MVEVVEGGSPSSGPHPLQGPLPLQWPLHLLNIKQIFLGSSGVRGLDAFLKRSFYAVWAEFRGNYLMQRTL